MILAATQQSGAGDMKFELITPTAPISSEVHGARAKCLQRLIRLGLPVPKTVALSFDTVRSLAAGRDLDPTALLAEFGELPLLSARPSAGLADWGGPETVLNIGMNPDTVKKLARRVGKKAAEELFVRFLHAFAVDVMRLDPEAFPDGQTAQEALQAYEFEMEEPFPLDPGTQLVEILRSMARGWEGTTARLLRQAQGAPEDAGLGLVVQEMALGLGKGESGAGVIQFVNAATGAPQITGRYLSQAQGREALETENRAIYLTRDPRGKSLEEVAPEIFDSLVKAGGTCRTGLREEMQIEFTLENGTVHLIDAVRVPRATAAGVRIAVALAEDGVIGRDEALMRVEPQAMTDLLHSHIDPDAPADILAEGIPASPGAATGKVVFTASGAQALAAQGEACILVRNETTPEDIRGMHVAQGVLTERGGANSHAAVIARGLGVPCVVGATDLSVRMREKELVDPSGRTIREGDVITIDGSAGRVIAGSVPLAGAQLDDSFATLMSWAEAVTDIGVRANADTPAEAATAARFGADGIGLSRTEHMFFEDQRLTALREMIFADDDGDRQAALTRLLPMQREDFLEIFSLMPGKPVCIRLFDPPLHEFLPKSKNGVRKLAEAMDLPISQVTDRVDQLSEFNPMLGLRGVRLGVTIPEIYEMQARAIFEAAAIRHRDGQPVVPEIMIPLVSAMREVELVRARIEAMAATVRAETGIDIDYRLGVMVETPRAALRAGDIATQVTFISYGTNDLTQMTYGLSRDDAGKFMRDYVQKQVFVEDPFHRLDTEGVGELLTLGSERARAAHPDIVLSICGEHGGNAESIAFCRATGIDYVSCSPYRVPVARLAAAQLALSEQVSPKRRTLSHWIKTRIARKSG